MFRRSPGQIGWLMTNRLGTFSGSSSCPTTMFYLSWSPKKQRICKRQHNKITMISLSEQILTFWLSSSFNGWKQVKVLRRMAESLRQLFCVTHVPVTLSRRWYVHSLKSLLIFFKHLLPWLLINERLCIELLGKRLYISPKINVSLIRHSGEILHITCLNVALHNWSHLKIIYPSIYHLIPFWGFCSIN